MIEQKTFVPAVHYITKKGDTKAACGKPITPMLETENNPNIAFCGGCRKTDAYKKATGKITPREKRVNEWKRIIDEYGEISEIKEMIERVFTIAPSIVEYFIRDNEFFSIRKHSPFPKKLHYQTFRNQFIKTDIYKRWIQETKDV